MVGTWRWNMGIACGGATVIFLVSFGHNPLQTAFFRVGIAFFVLYAMTFGLRWLLTQAMHTADQSPSQHADNSAVSQGEEGLGQRLDLVTPEEGERKNTFFIPLFPREQIKSTRSNDHKP
jgi:hypothetical protein